jgi:hypothetical protein
MLGSQSTIPLMTTATAPTATAIDAKRWRLPTVTARGNIRRAVGIFTIAQAA